MSYYKVKSINLRNWEDISIIAACNNVTPIYYHKSKYGGSIENLFQDLLSGNLQINNGNKQKVHEAYLEAKLYLRDNDVDTFELYQEGYKGNEYYENAFEIFKETLKKKQNKKNYYIHIGGRFLHGFTKYGYSYSYSVGKELTYIDLLRAKLCYPDLVTYEEIKEV